MKIWAELRRRRVLRFGGVYIVGAWLVFQVADVFFPAWGVPDAALRYLLYAAFGCFPIALVFSWFYDVSTSGITRTPKPEQGDQPDLVLKRADYLVLTALLLVTGTILYNSVGRVVESAGQVPAQVAEADKEKLPNSIAVLPFENLDSNPDTGYFSDGVSEEILHRLSSIKLLTVIAQSSSFALSKSDLGFDRISDLLGVRFMLGGSIRRAGGRVRVTARLLDDAGVQLWSETYDGDLRDIFDFQDTIAEQVAGRVTRELIVLESPVEARITSNSEAYSQYLIGREYYRNRPGDWRNKAAEAYRKAIEEDPQFAPPYAGLAIAVRAGAKIEGDADRFQVFSDLVDKALELDPNLAEAWMARALVFEGEPGYDPERNVEYLQKALELDPGRAIIYNALANAMHHAGYGPDQWSPIRQRGLELDPLNPPLVLNTSDVYLAASDFDGWKKSVSRLLALPEPPGMVYVALAIEHAEWGRYAEAIGWAREMLRAHGGQVSWHWSFMAMRYENLGIHRQADRWIDATRRVFPEESVGREIELVVKYSRGELEGQAVDLQWLVDFYGLPPDEIDVDLSASILASAGQWSEVIDILKEQVQMPDQYTETDYFGETNFWRVLLLAIAYEHAGRQDEADATIAWAKRRLGFLDPEKPFHDNPTQLIHHAQYFAAIGNRPRAAASLRRAVDAGWRDYYVQRGDPVWRGAWASPEFAPIVAEIVADLERQRLEVAATDAQNDFLAEIEALASSKMGSE